MSTREREKEKEIETLTDLPTLRKMRSSRKGQITKIENDLARYDGVSISSLKKLPLEAALGTLETQNRFYSLIQERILYLLQSEGVEDSVYEKEEREGDSQLLVVQEMRQQYHNHLKSIDISSKANRMKLKLKMFVDSDSLGDRDMETKLQAMEPLLDELLDAVTALPDLTELNELVSLVHRTYRNFTKDVLRAATSRGPIPSPTTHICSARKPMYGLPKTDMPTFEGDPKAWRRFVERFNQRLAMHPDLPAAEKIAQLEQAIKPAEGRALINAPKGTESEYQTSMEALCQRYDQPRKIYRSYVHQTFEQVTTYSRHSLHATSAQLKDAMTGLELYGGLDAGSVMVAVAERGFQKKVMAEWTAYLAKGKAKPTLDTLQDFLLQKADELDDDDVTPIHHKQQATPSPRPYNPGRKPPRSSFHTRETQTGCKLCDDPNHVLYQCIQFRALSVEKRQSTAQRLHVCNNCLGADHATRNCLSKRSCRTCSRRHHSLLHRSDYQGRAENQQALPVTPAQTVSQPQQQQHTSTVVQTVSQPQQQQHISTVVIPPIEGIVPTGDGMCNATPSSTSAILGTCITVIEAKGKLHKARALVDNGSGLTFITSRMVNTLKLRRLAESTSVAGIQKVSTPVSRWKVTFDLRVPSGNVTVLVPVQAVVVDVITGDLPSIALDNVKQSQCLQGLELADPSFDKPGRIDLLLGVNILPRVMLGERRSSVDQKLSATRSIYGWIVTGTCLSNGQLPTSHHCTEARIDIQTQELLTSFWKTEEVSSHAVNRTAEEEAAIQHFEDTHSRDPDGRYVVKLPRKAAALALGGSREQATKRYLQNERSLRRKGTSEAFLSAVLDYAQRGHAERVPPEDMRRPERDVYYLPMHGVTKESSTSTKLRIVFDASARTTSGISLNDQLLAGPNLYPQLTPIVIAFRSYPVALTGDISKMFREVGLHPSERDYHRYVVKGPEGEFQDWRMTRLTFGVTSSPFLATQVLRQVAVDHKDEHPKAAEVIRTRFYVDDVLMGAETVEEAKDLREGTTKLLQHAKMTLCKFRTNSKELRDTIPEDQREKESVQLFSAPEQCQKALGLRWDTVKDCMYVATPTISPYTASTKRQIASDAARTFDLLGWFSPSVVVLKLLLQKLWKLGMTWDEEVPANIAAEWRAWQEELSYITNYPIPRHYHHIGRHKLTVQLHGFSDASNLAYGGAVYIRTLYTDTSVTVSLVYAKTRVAPLSPPGTTPRLELCGAQLLSKLVTTAQDALKINLEDVYAWSDSTIVLCWLHMPPERLSTYVSNRVRDTLAGVPAKHWRYISTTCNPADLASRGVRPKELTESSLWWHGPPWLLRSPEEWPSRTDWMKKNRDLPELRKAVLVAVPMQDDITPRFSSYLRMVRVISWCYRFIFNLRQAQESRKSSHLTVQELQSTEAHMLQQSQQRFYANEIHCLQNGKEISRKSQLLSRRPFLDTDGLLKVGGRLRRIDIPDAQRHPIILHGKDPLTKLICRQTHLNSKHLGPTGMMGILSLQFHIIGVKAALKSLSKSCVVCQKHYARTSEQVMGQLPPSRANPAPPFTTTGADFAGPFILRKGHTRKPVWVKGYICLFICLTTRAVHLELVMDMSTEAFLAALRRFIARRGRPSQIVSDNGSNFVGARRELDEVYAQFTAAKTQDRISQFMTNSRIEWKHIPARTPHFGGIWEAGIKQMKALLYKHLGTQRLTSEELYTILTEVEAIMNSRPLSPLESAPVDGAHVLTPAHFLVGRSLQAWPDLPDIAYKTPSRKRWNLCKQLTQDLWERWSQDVLKLMQQNRKWLHPKMSVQAGDIVLLKDEELFYRSWPLGLVCETHPDADGVVRVATVRTEKGTYKRGVVRLVPLLRRDELAASGPPGGCSGSGPSKE